MRRITRMFDRTVHPDKVPRGNRAMNDLEA
jgi:hypothetical protein